MPRTTTTALLRTQKSRQQEIWNQEDAIKDYEWTLSEKSAEDFAAYTQHYKDRLQSSGVDGDKILTYQKRLTSANKAYTSNEIQRASIDIIEGRQPDEYKIQVLENMYRQAYQMGDLDLAQSLRYQIDNQYVQMQNRQLLEAAARGSYGGGSGGYGGGSGGDPWKEYIDGIDKWKTDLRNGDIEIIGAKVGLDGQPLTVNAINSFFEANGMEAANKMVKQYFGSDKEFADAYGKDADMFDVIYGTIAANYSSLKDSILQIDEPSAQKLALADLNKQMEKDSVTIGGKKMSLSDLYEGIALTNENPNNSPFVETYKNGKKQLDFKPVTGYFWQWDENGNFVELPTYAGGSDKTGFRQRFSLEDDEAVVNGYKTGDKIQYALNEKTGKFEIVPADKLKRNANGDLIRGTFQVDRGDVNKKGFDWKSAAVASYLAPISGGLVAGAAIYSGIKNMFGKKETVNNAVGTDMIEAAGFKKVQIGDKTYYQFGESAKRDLMNRGVTDFSMLSEDEFKIQGDELWFTRTDDQGNIRTFGTTQRVDGKDAVFGLDEKIGYDQDMLRNELVDQPKARDALIRSQLNVGGALQGGIGDLNSISGILRTNQEKIRLEEVARQREIQLRQQEAQRVAMLQKNVSIPAYSPPAPIRVTPRNVLQPAAPVRYIQPAAPARVFQPTVNPQPTGGYAGPGNQLIYSGNLTVRNAQNQYNLKVR